MGTEDTLHILTRVSSEVQSEDGYGLENQLQQGLGVAKLLKYKTKHWDEGAVSSSKNTLQHRPIITELLSEVESGNVKHLYVYAFDRLWRNDEVFSNYKLILFKGGVKLYTGSNPNPIDLNDPMERMMLNVMSSFAILDNELRTERFRLGRMTAVIRGGWKGGPPPYGYNLIDKKIVPNKEEKEAINLIFNLYLEGKGHDEIRMTLLSKGILTRRKNQIWSNASIDNILFNNTHYDGYWFYEDKVTKQKHKISCERLVPKNLYNDVQQIKKKRSYNSKNKRHLKESGRVRQPNQKSKYLLQNLLICGNCNSPFRVQKIKNGKENYGYYYCSNRPSIKIRSQKQFIKKHCEVSRTIKVNEIDELVWENFVDILSNSNLYKEQIKKNVLGETVSYSKSMKNENNKKNKIRRLETEIKSITENIVNLEVQKRTDSNIDIEQTDKIIKGMEEVLINKKLENEELNNEVEEGINNRKFIDWVSLFENHIKSLNNIKDNNIDDKKNIINGMIDKIEVSQKPNNLTELELHFKLPIVNDDLVWRNSNNKKEGYDLVEGENTKNLYQFKMNENFNNNTKKNSI